jgi:peptide methionine sulfoxide reductase msrA/msrB
MKVVLAIFLSLIYLFAGEEKMSKYNELTPAEERVILHKGTEAPYSGKYDKFYDEGTYTCKRCNAPLYSSKDKFSSGCGWPSFDDEIKGAIKRVPDADGRRIEIVCAACGAHLGHVFEGEGFTSKNSRHCVNSISMNFEPAKKVISNEAVAYFAGGCFWGVEYYFEKMKGVKEAISGYMGGDVKNPTYKQVCSGTTGHIEAVKVLYDPSIVSYEEIAKLFFEIHDPTQTNGQGPDIGSQYISAIFYSNEDEKKIAQKLINVLELRGYKVATKLINADEFYEAEAYHQNYYDGNGKTPYCHGYTKRF